MLSLGAGCKPKTLNYTIEMPDAWAYADVRVVRVGSFTEVEGLTVVTHGEAVAERGTEVDVLFPTPCGPKKVTFAIPYAPGVADWNGHTLATLAIPREAEPAETALFFDPALKATVRWGDVDITPDHQNPHLLWDVGCGGKLLFDGKEVEVPKLPNDKAKDVAFRAPDHAVLFTPSTSACFVEEVLVYGKSNDQDEVTQHTGSLVHPLKHTGFSYTFQQPPASVRVGTGSNAGGIAVGLRHCSGD
ncbi:MAG: hypothetical protein NT062_37925 [Proteobacteria bacterium]|nr:hypothetical protein [Pseudomonadota bacterium]